MRSVLFYVETTSLLYVRFHLIWQHNPVVSIFIFSVPIFQFWNRGHVVIKREQKRDASNFQWRSKIIYVKCQDFNSLNNSLSWDAIFQNFLFINPCCCTDVSTQNLFQLIFLLLKYTVKIARTCRSSMWCMNLFSLIFVLHFRMHCCLVEESVEQLKMENNILP